MNIVVLIPVYNEELRLPPVLHEVCSAGYSVIVVDDGSTDRTHQIVSRFKVTLLHHSVNLGKGAALKSGCDYAFANGADAVVMMDGDGQHLVSDLDKFVKVLNSQKYDIIFGSRNMEHGVPLVRFLGNKFASVVIGLMFSIYISDLLCGYRAITKASYKQLRWKSSGYGVETEMVVRTAKKHLRMKEIPVQTVYYDAVKGVTILDALNILVDVMMWKVKL